MYKNIELFYSKYHEQLLVQNELRPAKSITRDVVSSIYNFIVLYNQTKLQKLSRENIASYLNLSLESTTLSDHIKNMIDTKLFIYSENHYFFTSDFYFLVNKNSAISIKKYLLENLANLGNLSDFTMLYNLILCTLREASIHGKAYLFPDSFDKFHRIIPNQLDRIKYCVRVYEIYGFKSYNKDPNKGEYTPNANYRIKTTLINLGLVEEKLSKPLNYIELTDFGRTVLSKIDANLNETLKKQGILDNLGVSLEAYEILEQIENYEEEAFEQELKDKMSFSTDEIKIPMDIPIIRKESYADPKVYFPRDQRIISKAKQSSNYLCDFDQAHIFFQNKRNNKNYVEAHHLIPLHQQSNFEYSLDVPSNIVCLCPICHSKLHNGKEEDYLKILEHIYESRRERLKKSRIDVTFEQILKIYNR